MSTSKPSFIESVWEFFCSLKLSIALLIGLALTSIIGTVIPQGNIPPEYLQRISETKFKFYQAAGFFDMYHSWWFILLLYLLTVNLIACSIKRLPRVWKIVSEPQLVMDEKYEKSLALTHEAKVSGDAVGKMKSFLKGIMGEPVVTEIDGATYLYAQKAPWARLGVYVVHLSIIIIFIGAMLGSFFGYKAFVNIPEGTSVDTIYTQKEVPIKLDFALHLESFSVSYYNTGAPKEFKSILTVLENGKPVPGYTSIPTIVNKPLSYKGITFYQSSYGQSGEGSVYHFTLVPKGAASGQHFDMKKGDSVTIGNGTTLEVLEATQDVRQFMPEFSGPAAKVKLQVPGKQPETFIVFKDFPDIEKQRGGPFMLVYGGADEKLYTGLQVAKDPGVWIVWLGCALMTIGIYIAFFISHNRIWIRIANGRVVMGGSASKNPAGFERKFEEYVEKLNSL